MSKAAQKIKRLRQAKGLSQAELARRTGIHSSTISHLEAGRAPLWPGYVPKLSKALGVPVEEIQGAA